ncbi:MAG: 30S ribosomal protein S21 [Bacteriovoracaceae bacterium]|nr:30S ribosomal protein S21 [Bacteriovoracaceae bacterium]
MSKKNDNIKIDIADGMMVERALKKFKRMCDSYGIVKEYRKREAFIKPSVRLKEKEEAAEKRRKKTLVKMIKYSKKV